MFIFLKNQIKKSLISPKQVVIYNNSLARYCNNNTSIEIHLLTITVLSLSLLKACLLLPPQKLNCTASVSHKSSFKIRFVLVTTPSPPNDER